MTKRVYPREYGPSYFQKVTAVVGARRFWRRSHILHVRSEVAVPQRATCLSQIKSQVRLLEAEMEVSDG